MENMKVNSTPSIHATHSTTTSCTFKRFWIFEAVMSYCLWEVQSCLGVSEVVGGQRNNNMRLSSFVPNTATS